jgi:hypothetical protein
MALGRRKFGKLATFLAFAGIIVVAALVILELGLMTLASTSQPVPLAPPIDDASTTVAAIRSHKAPQTLNEQTAALANALVPTTGSRTLEQQTAALVALMANRHAAKAREGASPLETRHLSRPRQFEHTPQKQQIHQVEASLQHLEHLSSKDSRSSSQITNRSSAFVTRERIKSGASNGVTAPKSPERRDGAARIMPFIRWHHANAAYSPTADSKDGGSRVLIFIMTSALISRKRYSNKNLFEERAVPAMRTWAAAFPRTWFVMDAGPAATAALVNCHFAPVVEASHGEVAARARKNNDVEIDASSLPPLKKFKAANWTIADCSTMAATGRSVVSRPVLMADCNNGYWGAGGPCCKCEAALRFAAGLLAHVKHDLDNPNRHRRHISSSHESSSSDRHFGSFGLRGSGAPVGPSVAPFDWILYSDDDMYYAPKPFLAFLQRHDPNVAQVGVKVAPFVVRLRTLFVVSLL